MLPLKVEARRDRSLQLLRNWTTRSKETGDLSPPPSLPSLSPMWRELGTMGMAPLAPMKPHPLALPSLSPRRRVLGKMGRAIPKPTSKSLPSPSP